jgi:hypothetical protein
MKVGVVCLTPENLTAPWILYEAGALSKAIGEKERLCTYLLGGLEFQDVKPPLGMFQATMPTKEDTQKLIRTINKAVSDNPVPEVRLDTVFDRLWAELETKLGNLPEIADQIAVQKRSLDEIVTEILEIARADVRYRDSLQVQLSNIENSLNLGHFSSPRGVISVPTNANWIGVSGGNVVPLSHLGGFSADLPDSNAFTLAATLVDPNTKPEGDKK